jgi:class 3 adenylate cyclase
MEDQDLSKVIEFPVHRRGSLADTLHGFPERDDGPAWKGTRREEHVSLLVADLRGHREIAGRLGVPAADAEVAAALAAAVEVVRSFGGGHIAVGGGATQPVVGVEFAGEAHARTALTAAVRLREAVELAADGVVACAGINSGSVADTTLGGAIPVAYRAMGTLRMFAVRLQEFAGPGEIYASASTVAGLRPGVAKFRSIGQVRTNAGGETAEAYSLIEVVRPARTAEHGSQRTADSR